MSLRATKRDVEAGCSGGERLPHALEITVRRRVMADAWNPAHPLIGLEMNIDLN